VDKNIASYLAALAPRLVLMRALLSDTGSIYLHLDWHIAYYMQVMMDQIFSKDKFVGRIIWYYPETGDANKCSGEKKHRIILQYTRPESPVSDDAKDGAHASASARTTFDVHAWCASGQAVDPAHQMPVNGQSDCGIGMSERDMGDKQRTVITRNIRGSRNEQHAWLLERIIKASSHADSIVADFFSGSATTAEVAAKLGRRWIISECDESACMTVRRRLKEQNASSFLYQAIEDD
jgi:adenine-specific DNA-methyltransferase